MRKPSLKEGTELLTGFLGFAARTIRGSLRLVPNDPQAGTLVKIANAADAAKAGVQVAIAEYADKTESVIDEKPDLP